MRIKTVYDVFYNSGYTSVSFLANYRYKKGEKMFEAKNHSLNF